jgi:long-chain acyl-CoA synthetase
MVLSNGEKVPPADMEMAITLDPMVEQTLIVGEGKPYLSAIVVLEPEAWKVEAETQGFDVNDPTLLNNKETQKFMLERIALRLKNFPGYAKVRAVTLLNTPWTIESGTMTPTMKLRRAVILEKNQTFIDAMYEGH